MKRKWIFVVGLLAVLTVLVVPVVSAGGHGPVP
jgi:hypothetical protein